MKQFAAMGSVLANGFAKNLGNAEKFASDPLAMISANLAVFITMAAIMCITISGLMLTSWKDNHDVPKYYDHIAQQHTKLNIKMNSRDVKEFMNDALPDEFTGQPWSKRFWTRYVSHSRDMDCYFSISYPSYLSQCWVMHWKALVVFCHILQ